MGAAADLSVIVPTLNEANRLEEALAPLRNREMVEVIVADGGSDDGTVELARRLGAATVRTERGRARQMNAGAACATGKAFLFLHADTRLPGNFEKVVRKALAGDAVAGAFRLALDDDAPFLRFITMTANFRACRMGIIFGDQAIFTRADAFRQAGGFPDQPLMEDYEFIRRLRRVGEVVVVGEAAVTSARRWRQVGAVRNTLANVLITWAYVLGVRSERLCRWHRWLAGAGG